MPVRASRVTAGGRVGQCTHCAHPGMFVRVEGVPLGVGSACAWYAHGPEHISGAHSEHIRSTRGAPCENFIVSDLAQPGLHPTRKRFAEAHLLPYIASTTTKRGTCQRWECVILQHLRPRCTVRAREVVGIRATWPHTKPPPSLLFEILGLVAACFGRAAIRTDLFVLHGCSHVACSDVVFSHEPSLECFGLWNGTPHLELTEPISS